MENNEITEKFEEIYKSQIEPNAERLEPYRLEQKKKHDWIMRLSIVLCFLYIVTGILGIYTGQELIPTTLIILLFVITMAFAIIFSIKISEKYIRKVKSVLLKPILTIFGDFRLEKSDVLPLKEIRSLGLYYNAQKKKDDDIISGSYHNIPITIIETNLSHTNKTDKNTQIVNDFNGLILKIKMNKNFEGITIGEQKVNIDNFIKLIKESSNEYPPEVLNAINLFLNNPIFNTIGKAQRFMNNNKLFIRNGKLYIDIFDKYTKNKVTKQLEQVFLEDTEFNDSYNIYSDNQVESRYLLTPTFMERLKNIQAVFLVLSVNFAFKDGYLYLFLDKCMDIMPEITKRETKGFFEVGTIETSLLNKNRYFKITHELMTICSLIDYFKLNEKTGL